MARRRTVLGLPIGRKKPSIAPKVIAGAAGAAALAALPAANAIKKVGGVVSAGRQGLKTAASVAEKASGVAEAVGRHGTTIGKAGAMVNQLRKGGGQGGPAKLSHIVEEHVDVAVAREVAYNQWTQFETFPAIVKGAERVEQRGRDRVEWTAKIGPSHRSWQGEIVEQVPDERIAWKSKGGLRLKGVVTFHSLDEALTRVQVELEYDPRGPVETVGNLLRIQRRRVRRDLRLFKHFVELRGEETGAWRSRVAKKEDLAPGAGASGGVRKAAGAARKVAGAAKPTKASGTGRPRAAKKATAAKKAPAGKTNGASRARGSSAANGTSRAGGSSSAHGGHSAGGASTARKAATSSSNGSRKAAGTRKAAAGNGARPAGTRKTASRNGASRGAGGR